MGTYIGPEISNAGLVLSVDMGNIKSFRGLYNTANLATWVFGTGTISNWSNNGVAAENQRVANTNPLGISSLVWDTPSNDATSDADGGFSSTSWIIDPNYYYRFSVWIKRYILGNGSTYFGLYGYNASSQNMGVLTRAAGANNTNPYFVGAAWGSLAGGALATDTWYLFVGHVHPVGSGTGSIHPDTGFYNTSGSRISTGLNDFVWMEGNSRAPIRSYLYYSTDTTTAQQWWQPRIDKMDGTEPSIAELCAGAGGRLIDLSRSGATVFAVGGAENGYTSTGIPAMKFNGSNSYYQISNLYDFSASNQFTISVWVKSNQTNWNATGTIFSRRNQFVIHPEVGEKRISFFVYTTTWQSVEVTLSDITVWNHLVLTYNAGSLKAYVNGSLGNSGSVGATLGSDTGDAYLGWDDGQATRYLDGLITMSQAWNRELSGDEVARLFNATRSRHGV